MATLSESVDPAQLGHAPPERMNMSHSENEDDVDQLDSESDVEAKLDASSAAQQRPVLVEERRIPGHSLLPMTRIENVIQAECTCRTLFLSCGI